MECLYETILQRRHPVFPGFEALFNERDQMRAKKIHRYLLDRAERLDADCMLGWDKPARKSRTRWVFDTPWQEEETPKHFCTDDCADVYLHEPPFAYFRCDPCQREICAQHPQNGWQIQYRELNGNQVCLKCYESAILENGMEITRSCEGC